MGVVKEFEGDSLDDALEAASAALGIPVDDLHYEMVEQGRKGVFGLGARQVRVRVEMHGGAAAPPPPAEVESAVRSDRPPPRSAARAEPKSAVRSEKAPPRSAARAEPESAEQVAFRETLERMLDLMRLKMRVRVSASGSNLRAVLTGKDRRMLLQKDAQLLSALNFLLNRMARRAWPGVGRIQVHCDGQRDRRDDELVELVREVASQVARTGKPKELHPMNPYERRLAHITVRDFTELDSYSEGDGFVKKIIVKKK